MLTPVPSPSPSPAPSPSPNSSVYIDNIIFDTISSTYINCTWENGNSDNLIVIVSDKPDLDKPIDGYDSPLPSAEYNKVLYTDYSSIVYKGNLERITVFNFSPSTKYYFYFFEYDIINGVNVYRNIFKIESVYTMKRVPSSSVYLKIYDNLTDNLIDMCDIVIMDRNNNIISKGVSSKGNYTSHRLPVGGVSINISSPGYESISLRSVFIKNFIDNKSAFNSPNNNTYIIKLNKQT